MEEEYRADNKRLALNNEDLAMELKRSQTLLADSQAQAEASHKEYLRVKVHDLFLQISTVDDVLEHYSPEFLKAQVHCLSSQSRVRYTVHSSYSHF